ncbi:MAG: DUF4384 domain-containing protein [Bacteroidota bacterium]
MKVESRIFLQLLCLSIVLTHPAISQEGKWTITTGRYIGTDVTPDEGKKHALDIARAEAIKQVVGVKVSEELFRNVGELMNGKETEEYFDTFSKLSRSTAVGRILKEQVQYITTIENELPVYKVTLRALVAEEEGTPDPTFKVELSLRNPLLFDRGDVSKNDGLQFKIIATQHCYLYVFNLLSNDTVQLILPNKLVRNNLFDIEKKVQDYERDIRQMEMRFTVGLPKGSGRAKEALYVIALKDNIKFNSEHFSQEGNNTIPTYKSAIIDIMNWLVQIPAERRTETFQSYEIRRSLE